jgi:putative FmdB family regulatory protein
MPIYEYFCSKCNMEFELRLLFSEADKSVTCPKCNTKAKKQFSSFGCKTGSALQASEKPFRKYATKEMESPIPKVLITPPPKQAKLLSPPAKKKIRTQSKNK